MGSNSAYSYAMRKTGDGFMIEAKQKKILILAVRAGELMMKSGAEIYRVEDTITRICKACGIHYVEVFAMQTGIFVSLDTGDEDRNMYTYIKRIKGVSTDLTKISELNRFSREFTTTDLSVEEGMQRLKEINRIESPPLPLRLLGAALVSSFFSLLFGGGVLDFLCAFLIGAASYFVSRVLSLYSLNFFIRGFCCCALAAFLALSISSMVPGTNYNAIIIGALMIFVPGVAITNSIRDFLSGDTLSGLTKAAEAGLVAISLAAGVGMVLRIWYSAGGVAL